MTTATLFRTAPAVHLSVAATSPMVSEPAAGLPIPLFQDAHAHRSERKTLSRVIPWGWGETYSVYMQSELAQDLVRSMEPAWATVRQLQAAYLARVQRTESEFDSFALLDLDVDPAASQEWTIRTYTVSTTPDDSIPVFHPDDFDFED